MISTRFCPDDYHGTRCMIAIGHSGEHAALLGGVRYSWDSDHRELRRIGAAAGSAQPDNQGTQTEPAPPPPPPPCTFCAALSLSKIYHLTELPCCGDPVCIAAEFFHRERLATGGSYDTEGTRAESRRFALGYMREKYGKEFK